jgi:PhoH-like ATPase
MKKTFVLDTNVLLHDPGSLLAFEENEVVIPLPVIEEVDRHKKRQDEVGRHAREVSRILDRYRSNGRLAEGVNLPNGGTLRIEINHQNALEVPAGLEARKQDNRILAVARSLNGEKRNGVILVTKDLNLRIKADVLDIPAEDFLSDKVDYRRLYEGVAELELSGEEMDRFYREGRVALTNGSQPLPNQFLVARCRNNPSQSALSRHWRQEILPLHHADGEVFGVRARNKEQKFAMEALSNNHIQIVTLVGRAGTGKTLLALAVGLDKVLERNQYSRLLITRPVIPMGDDLGYLPGSKEEKLRPWMQPIYDNLEFLFGRSPEPFQVIEHLMQRGVLEMEALTYIRGRSIPKQFIVCDEAQNLSPHMVKTLVTRVGEGSKIVFTGDPEQIDHPYLDASSNGLTHLVERLKAEEIAAHVTLTKGERSTVAELGSRLL